uniref:Uncharacterized protein n=1 Tax=Panagrolaimus sp. JU765 TaxID=591449 RepID=A0AC34QWX5_9BILA
MTTQFTKLFSFILANVHDPAPQLEPAYRMQCHSCMSPYLEDQFMYINHLYRRPLAFTEKCDFNNFDGKYMRTKNCTDLCVSIRMNDKVGGRRRFGYMRGCMSDIIHYNRSVIRDYPGCYPVRLRDLFISSERYAFDPLDSVELCPCAKPFCNSAPLKTPPFLAMAFAALLLVVFPQIQLIQQLLLQIQDSCTYKIIPRSTNQKRISRHSILEIGVS